MSEAKSNLSTDETVVAYRFVRGWKTKEGTPVMNKGGHQVESLSAYFPGGAAEGRTGADVLAGIASGELVEFLNGKVTVVKKAQSAGRGNLKPM